MEVEVNDSEMLEQFVKNHEENYKNAVIEIIKNNTKTLVDEDIASLIKEPPLASMDGIKQKLLSLAKKEKIILDDSNLKKLLSKYRLELFKRVDDLKELRNKPLIDKIVEFSPKRETEVIEISSNDLESVDKKMKQRVKKGITECIDSVLLEDIETIYKDNEDVEKKQKISGSFLKFMKTSYQKQLVESMAIKVMVKNRTLINDVSEQGEGYLFIKSKSHIFNTKRV